MVDLTTKVALITGGGRGIGQAIALALAGAGAAVVVTGRTYETLEETCGQIRAQGGQALGLTCDVAHRDSVYAAVEQARATFGPIDILVNNAGITFSAKFTDTSEETWERVIQTNVNGPFYCCKAVVPTMIARQWGRIINMASIAATVGIPFSSAYGASKHALLGMTRSLALEFARYNITVNAICPGWVETDMFRDSVATVAAKTNRSLEEARTALLKEGGQERVIMPEEIGAVVLRLVGPEGAGTQGEAIMMR